jgi:hypothetical protein
LQLIDPFLSPARFSTQNMWIICCRRHESSSSSRSIIFFFRDEELGWTFDGTDGWKGRPPRDIIYKMGLAFVDRYFA